MTYVPTYEPFTWSEYSALPIALREGVEAFWEPGYDYSDPDMWSSYDPTPSPDFIAAVQMYDALRKVEPADD